MDHEDIARVALSAFAPATVRAQFTLCEVSAIVFAKINAFKTFACYKTRARVQKIYMTHVKCVRSMLAVEDCRRQRILFANAIFVDGSKLTKKCESFIGYILILVFLSGVVKNLPASHALRFMVARFPPKLLQLLV